MTRPNVLFLFQGGYLHEAHVGFSKALNAELRHFETAAMPTSDHLNQDVHSEIERLRAAKKLPRGYDVVVAEGSAALQTLVWYGVLSDQDVTTVLLACDETFLYVSEERMHYVWQLLRPLTQRIDGCLSISKLVHSWVEPYLPSAKHDIVYPTTSLKKFDALMDLTVEQPSGGPRLLSVGSARPMKNYRNLVEAVSRVRDQGIDARLTLIGSGHEHESYADESFVTTPGFVNQTQLFREIENSNLYVQPSNGDGFGVAALEAMLAGRPVLVSERTGVKELLNGPWITETTPDAIGADLERILRMNRDRLVSVGEKNRSCAAELSPSRQAERFVRAIESISEVQ